MAMTARRNGPGSISAATSVRTGSFSARRAWPSAISRRASTGKAEEARKLQRQIAFHARSYAQDMPLPAGVMKALLTSRNPLAMRLRHYVKRLLRGPGKTLPAAAGTGSHGGGGQLRDRDPRPRSCPSSSAARSGGTRSHWYDVIQGYTIQSVYPAAAGPAQFPVL